MFHLKNLSSQTIQQEVLPWDYKPPVPIPDNLRTNKKLRDQWINAPVTAHHVYTFNEGINPNLRISKPRPDGGGNPIHACHALVADYDSPQPLEKVLDYIKGLTYPPNWVERTLSGNWRLIWGLEEALIFPSDSFARHFLKSFADYAFDPSRILPGFDKKAWEAPERLWTNGCDWRFIQDKTIPANISNGWLVKAGMTFRFTEKEFGPAIPLELVKAELIKQHPRILQWDGDFVLNAQGPSFWIQDSVSPKSAIVRETGMQTFSSHAAKGFYTWADLLGMDFVRAYEAETIGQAVKDIYFDGRAYWRQLPDQSWKSFEKEDIKLHFRASRKLSAKPGPDGLSLLERALEHIQNNQHIAGAAPFVYQPSGIVTRNGERFLNVSNRRVLEPAEGLEIWGPNGNFPWISMLFNLFSSDKSRQVVLAWLAWAYKHAYKLEPTGGQVLFIAGPVGIGKTLLNRAVFGKLFGGFAEAGAFLMGEDNFNSELLGAPFWCLDDGSPSVDQRKMRYFSFMLKRIAANGEFRVNEKFKKAVMGEWLGRLCITCNADEESIALLPESGLSNREKLILVRTTDKAPVIFPERAEIERILSRELPHFARYLLDMEIPKELLGESRFGIKEYADPTLLETSRQSSLADGFLQILEDWREEYFTNREPQKDYWQGTAFQLHKEILIDPQAEVAMRAYPLHTMSRRLFSLKQAGARIDIVGPEAENPSDLDLRTRQWRIHRITPKI